MKTINQLKAPQRDRKHQAIIDASIQVFLENGFGSASMDEIAKRAAVSKRTVYDHFGNKENLFQTILTEHWNSIFELNSLQFNNSQNIKDGLTIFAKKFMLFLYQPKTISLFRLLISESDRFPQLLNSLVINEKAPFTRALITFLDHQSKSGKLKIKDIELAASFFMGMLKEAHFWPMMLGFTKLKQPNKNHLIKEVIEVFIKAYT